MTESKCLVHNMLHDKVVELLQLLNAVFDVLKISGLTINMVILLILGVSAELLHLPTLLE